MGKLAGKITNHFENSYTCAMPSNSDLSEFTLYPTIHLSPFCTHVFMWYPSHILSSLMPHSPAFLSCTPLHHPQAIYIHVWPVPVLLGLPQSPLASLCSMPTSLRHSMFFTKVSCCFPLNDFYILRLWQQVELPGLPSFSNMVMWHHILQMNCLVITIRSLGLSVIWKACS